MGFCLFVCLSVLFCSKWMERFPSTMLSLWFITVYHWPLVKTWSCILGTFLGLFFYTLFCLQTMLGWNFITGFEINTVIPPTVILPSLDCLGHLRFFVNVEFIFNFCKKNVNKILIPLNLLFQLNKTDILTALSLPAPYESSVSVSSS